MTLRNILPLLALICLATPCSGNEGRRPNILLIISDDQGYSDFGFMGNPIVRTPNLDRLAANGAVLRNFAVGAACSPTRSMIFTGREHLLAGVWSVPPRQNLHTDEAMMPAFFKAAGYDTCYLGKNDCVAQHHTLPWFAGWNHSTSVGGYQHFDANMQYKPDGDMPATFGYRKSSGWTAEVLTDEAIRFIEEKQDDPWLLTMAYIIPHTPWSPVDERTAPYYRKKGCTENNAACYSHIEQLDACIGRLMATLKKAGQDRKTLVLFLSDNGPTGPYGKQSDREGYIDNPEWKARNVKGLRGKKSLVWENGIRVPLIACMPGTIPAGDREQFGAAEDILPTVLDYAGIDDTIVQHKPFTGVSLRPALDKSNTVFNHPDVFRMTVHGDGMVSAPKGYVKDPLSLRFEDHHMVLRGAKYKLHARPGGEVALYDIVKDMGETKEVSAKYPEVAKRMLAECRKRWSFAIGDGGAFRMARIVVGDPATWKYRDGTFWGYGAKVQELRGNVRVVRASVQGFASEGDRAVYKLDVVNAGNYDVTLKGRDLERAGHLSINVAGRNLSAQETADESIEFGDVELPLGEINLEITAGKPDGKIQPVKIERILFKDR